MRKLWRRFRTAKQQHEEEEIALARAKYRATLKQLFEEGHEAEAKVVAAAKEWNPDITREELQKLIRQFHDAVSARQWSVRDSTEPF